MRSGNLLESLAALPASPVGHREAEHMLRAECVRAQLRDEGRIDAAAEPEDDALPTALAERVGEERLDDEDLLLLDPRDQLGHGSATFGAVIKPCGAKPLSREVSWRRARERERGDPRVGRRV